MHAAIRQLFGTAHTIPMLRFRIFLMLGAALTLFVLTKSWIDPLVAGTERTAPNDFPAFWTAIRAAINLEAAALYDATSFRATAGSEGLLWLYPPTFLLLLWPLGILPEATAQLVWLLLTLICGGLVARLVAPRDRLLQLGFVLGPAMMLTLHISQAGAFFACLMTAGLVFSRTRPILAGLLIALLTVKPQYGLFIPLFLVAAGHWRTVGTACVASIVLGLVSIAVYGIAPWQAMIEAMAGPTRAHLLELNHISLLSPAQAARFAGFSAGAAAGVQGLFLTLGGIAVIAAARARLAYELKIAALLVATALASPYFWLYDLVILQAALFLILRARPDLRPAGEYLVCAMLLAPAAFFLDMTQTTHLLYAGLRAAFAGWLIWLMLETREKKPRADQRRGQTLPRAGQAVLMKDR